MKRLNLNWRFIIGLSFGFFMWYVGVNLLTDQFVAANCKCCPTSSERCEP